MKAPGLDVLAMIVAVADTGNPKVEIQVVGLQDVDWRPW
jgi:hypothetical protein